MLTKLKTFLKEQKIDFFLLPNSDEFFSEYLTDSEKRIERLTGFSGSNATVIFGQEKSFFFTDGRYILQAKKQLDLNEFEIFNLAETPLLSVIPEDARLAINSRLVSVNFVRQLQKKFSNNNLVILDQIDEIPLFVRDDSRGIHADNGAVIPNEERDLVSHSPFFELPEKLTGINSEAKCIQILQGCAADAILLTKPENICWLLNIRGRDLEFTPTFLTYAFLLKTGEVKLFKNEIPELGSEIKKIQLDENATNYWLYSSLQKNNLTLINQPDLIDLPKSQKNPTEISGAIKAHEEDGIAVTKFLFWLTQIGETDEISAAKKLLEFRQESRNFFSESFAAISGFASNGAVIHYHSTPETNKTFAPTKTLFEKEGGAALAAEGDFRLTTSELASPKSPGATRHPLFQRGQGQLYLIDSGGQYLGEDFCGTTDITRTVAIGNPTDEMCENFTRVLKGHIALARAKFPRGTSGAQLDVLAREHLWRAGLNYDHGTGHGVSSFLSVHEGPCGISKRAHQELLPGMILSNEPGFYKEGEYGIRIENLLLVEAAAQENFLQFRTITLAPLDFNLINFSMLTRPERKWLFNYHCEILEKFSLALESKISAWLAEITKIYQEKI